MAIYCYTDENDKPYSYVGRTADKKFPQWLAGSGGRFGLQGQTCPYLYHLPRLLEGIAKGETIHFVEGEKDVLALEAKGYYATCNPGGAEKLTSRQADWLQRASRVVIWADKDSDGKGRSHARKAKELISWEGPPLRVVEAKSGKDAYDHFAAGHSIRDAVPVILRDEPEKPATETGAETQTKLPRAALTLLGTYVHRAQTEAQPRNEAGFHLALQLRNHRIPKHQAEEVLRLYVNTVPDKENNSYTVADALASVAQAYAQEAKKPYLSIEGTEDDFEEEVATAQRRILVYETAKQRHENAKLAAEWVMAPALQTLADDLAVDRPALEFSIAELHVKGGNTILIAKYKTGKSTLNTNLLRSFVDNVPFLGLYAVRKLEGRAALWNYELIADQAVGWLRKAGIKRTDRASLWNLRGYRLPLTVPYVQEQAIAWLTSREVEVLIVDPFSRAYTGSENDNTELKQFTEALDYIKREAGVVDLFMAVHMGRERLEAGEERGRGATHLDDWPDVRWVLTRDGERRYFYAEGRDVLVAEQGLAFDPQTKALTVVGGNRRDERDREHVRKVCEVVRDNPGIGLGELRASEGLGKADKRTGYINTAVEMKLIEAKKEGNRHAHYITEKGTDFVDHKATIA